MMNGLVAVGTRLSLGIDLSKKKEKNIFFDARFIILFSSYASLVVTMKRANGEYGTMSSITLWPLMYMSFSFPAQKHSWHMLTFLFASDLYSRPMIGLMPQNMQIFFV